MLFNISVSKNKPTPNEYYKYTIQTNQKEMNHIKKKLKINAIKR